MEITALSLARFQFGITLLYHFWFVALTLGLSVILALMESIYVYTGKRQYRTMAYFFGKLFFINYAIGVVTGIVQEFQFGMNWSEYSRFVGGIFGPPLAFEALTAFFVGSTAIGIWHYGWKGCNKYVHLLAIWLVALSSNYSAYWILSANAFMQYPVGYVLQDGRIMLANFTALITNTYLLYQFSHTLLAGMVTAGCFLMAISAYQMVRNCYPEIFRISFRIGLTCAWVAILAVTVTGHIYTQYLVKVHPMKVAAMEAHWHTQQSAPFILLARIDEAGQRNSMEVAIPKMLSVMAGNRTDSHVRGIIDIQEEYQSVYGPGNYIPPVDLTFWSFRIMVGIGLWIIALATLSAWFWWKGTLEQQKSVLNLIIWSWPLPHIANSVGWIVAEVGRQPWLVFGLQRTEQGLSRIIPLSSVLITCISYTMLYALIALAAFVVMRKIIRSGPVDEGG